MIVKCYKDSKLVKTYGPSDDVLLNFDELLVDGECITFFNRDESYWSDPGTDVFLYTHFVFEN